LHLDEQVTGMDVKAIGLAGPVFLCNSTHDRCVCLISHRATSTKKTACMNWRLNADKRWEPEHEPPNICRQVLAVFPVCSKIFARFDMPFSAWHISRRP